MRRLLLLCLPAVLALVIAGCGASSGGDFSGASQDVADKIEELQSAGERSDESKICQDVLAPALRQKIAQGGLSCNAEVDDALGDADDFDLAVESVKITGNTATARVKARIGSDKNAIRTMTLTRDGQRWLISDLGG
jgi:hypothetical protein